jgi:Na+/melibiose symporter-like transporter
LVTDLPLQYCTQILAWLPPLIFTLLVQNEVDQKYGVISVSFGFLAAVLLLSCTSSWDEILAEADHNKNVHLLDYDVVDVIEKDVPTTKQGSDEELSL